MDKQIKQAIDRVQNAQKELMSKGFEGISLQLDTSGDGCIHIWAHNQRNGKNKIHCKGFVAYQTDVDEWFTIGRSIRKYNTSVMLSKVSQFIGFDI